MKYIKVLLSCICLLVVYRRTHTVLNIETFEIEQKQIEIKGEVKNPGTFEVAYDATLRDVIELAGGALEQADISSLNMTQQVLHHEVIVIPLIKEEVCISISTASKEELMELTNVGESTAQRIIDYRAEHKFLRIEDIMNVTGIKEKTFDKLKDRICL